MDSAGVKDFDTKLLSVIQKFNIKTKKIYISQKLQL